MAFHSPRFGVVKLRTVAVALAEDLCARPVGSLRAPAANAEVVLYVLASLGRYLRRHPQQILPMVDALVTRAGQDLGRGTRHGTPR
jgi:hypothetical protein